MRSHTRALYAFFGMSILLASMASCRFDKKKDFRGDNSSSKETNSGDRASGAENSLFGVNRFVDATAQKQPDGSYLADYDPTAKDAIQVVQLGSSGIGIGLVPGLCGNEKCTVSFGPKPAGQGLGLKAAALSGQLATSSDGIWLKMPANAKKLPIVFFPSAPQNASIIWGIPDGESWLTTNSGGLSEVPELADGSSPSLKLGGGRLFPRQGGHQVSNPPTGNCFPTLCAPQGPATPPIIVAPAPSDPSVGQNGGSAPNAGQCEIRCSV